MKHLKTFIIPVALLLLIAAPAALAQQESARKPGHFLKCLSILGLSDSQKADIKHALETEKPVMKGLVQTLKSDAEVLKTALEHNPPDGCTIGSDLLMVHADKGAIRTELEKIKTNVEAILTAEQKAKLEGCLQARQPPVAATAAEDDDFQGE